MDEEAPAIDLKKRKADDVRLPNPDLLFLFTLPRSYLVRSPRIGLLSGMQYMIHCAI